jgi:hypothetical protein
MMAEHLDEKYVFGAGVISLVFVVVLMYVLADDKGKLNDPLFYGKINCLAKCRHENLLVFAGIPVSSQQTP